MSTITSLQTTDTGSASRGIINTNFTNLNTDKLEKSGGTLTGEINFSGTTHAGVKLNSLTTTQRDALTPANGMIIYNTTTGQVEKYESGSWVGATGVANATDTVEGIVELATQSEIDNDTATGGSGAALAITPDQLVLSKYGTGIPTSDQKAALAGTSGTPSSTNKYVTADDVSDAAGSGKIVRASGTALPALDGSALTGVSITNGLITKSYIAGENLTAGNAVIASYENEALQATWAGASDSSQGSMSTTFWYAQTFITSATAAGIKKLTWTRGGSEAGGSGYVIKLRATSAGSPTGADLISVAFTSGGGGEQVVTFDYPIPVSPNTTYALIVAKAAGTGSWYATAAGGYASGSAYSSSDSGANWSPIATIDLKFGIYETTTNGTVLYKADASTADKYANAFIGFAAETKSSGASTKVNLLVDNNQSGLLIGTTYYLSDTSGAIAASAGSTSRKVGVAISATEILVKQDNV